MSETTKTPGQIAYEAFDVAWLLIKSVPSTPWDEIDRINRASFEAAASAAIADERTKIAAKIRKMNTFHRDPLLSRLAEEIESGR